MEQNLTNYSYLELQYAQLGSSHNQLSNLNSIHLSQILSLLSTSGPSLILSHSSVNSQFGYLQQELALGNSQMRFYDFSQAGSAKIVKDVQWSQAKSDEVIVISVFHQYFESYFPVLVQVLSTISKESRVLIYCDSHQEPEIANIANEYGNPFMVINYSRPMPYEVSRGRIMEEMKKFLVEESKQSQKMDIVLFHPLTETILKEISLMLRTHGLLPTVNVISSGTGILNPELSNVIVVNDTETLFSWGYDLSQVYLVLDSGLQHRYYFDYCFGAYLEELTNEDSEEMNRRMTVMTSRMGQYIYDDSEERETRKADSKIKSEHLDEFVLKVYWLGLSNTIMKDFESSEMTACINSLKANKILVQEDGKLKLMDDEIVRLVEAGINPIFAKILRDFGERPEITSQMALLQAIMLNDHLRPIQDKYRPSGIWRQSGYLHSCLDLIIKVQVLVEKHLNGDISSDDDDDIFSLRALSKKYTFDIKVYESIVQEHERILSVVKAKKVKWERPVSQEEFDELLEIFIQYFRTSIAFNSGSRRLGYYQKGKQTGILSHKSSLMSMLSERPSFILLTKIKCEKGSKEIYTCNYVADEIMISAYGALPVTSKQSFGECDIEFHDISSSIYAHLSKYNCLQMEIFQRDNECSVELNEELGIISLQCSKLNEKKVRENFQNLLNEVREMYKKEARIVRYSKTLSSIIGAGGMIKELIVKEELGDLDFVQDTCIITNLDPEVELIDLKDLFDEFVQIKEITIKQKEMDNEAIITFYSYEDYKTFNSYFQSCEYLGRRMILNPYVPQIKNILPEKYLLYEWNQWKSKCEAIIQMEDESGFKKAMGRLKELGLPVKQSGQRIMVGGLQSINDEKDLEVMLTDCGKMKSVEVLRYSGKSTQDDYEINKIINGVFKGDNVVFNSENMKKGKNGYRSKKVMFEKDEVMKEAYFLTNEILGRVGTGKLYATPTFTYPVKLPNDESYIPVYLDIIEDVSEEMGRMKPIETEVIVEREAKYVIIKANEDAEVDLIVNFLSEKLQGCDLNVKVEDNILLFSELGLKKIMSLEKKFCCKFTPDFLKKTIKVLARPKIINLIEKEINTRLVEECSLTFPLFINAYKFIQSKLPQLRAEHKDLNEAKIDFEEVTKSLTLVGRISQIEKCKKEISRIIKNMKSQSEMNEGDCYCGICCEQISHPFKLQSCGHKFCYECLQSFMRMTIRDISMYPIKCPECLESILVSDLNCLSTQEDWKDIIAMSVNHFVFTHPEDFIFCFTVSCPQINKIENGKWFRCRECKKGYCLTCKGPYHPGMSCDQARYGSDRLLKEYLEQSGGRKCANKSCKSPIIRISGCFKVQCTRCKKCMCFKCPEKSMVAYDSPNQTYNHMDLVHGGCF